MKINLQLFTASDTGYFGSVPITQNTTTSIASRYDGVSANTVLAGLSPEIKEYYSNYLIKSVEPNIIHAQFGDKENLPKGHGDTIEWRKWSSFAKATTPLTEGVTPAPHGLTVSMVRAKLNQYGDWSPITDKLQLEAIDNTVVEFTTKHAENAKLTLDTITREALISGCSNYAFAGGAASIPEMNATITVKDVAKLATFLKNNNAPKFDGSYVCIIHPSVSFDLMTSDKWIDVVKYSDSVQIFNGEIGKLYGIRFVESTEAKIVKAKKIGSGTAAGTKAVVTAYDSTNHVATVAANTFTADELNGKKVYVHDVSADALTVEEMTVSDTGTGSITFSAEATFTIAAGDTIYLPTSAVDGNDYFVCIALGKGAYKVTELDGANAEIIVKPKGYGDDPLEQRSSVGWKCDGYAAKVINEAYIYKFYACSEITGVKDNA